MLFHSLDPRITMNNTDLLIRNDLVEVWCSVDEAAGEPLFSLRYQGTGSNNISTLTERKSQKHLQKYAQWIHTTVLRVPDQGIIICQVTDTFGRYSVQVPILVRGMIYDHGWAIF